MTSRLNNFSDHLARSLCEFLQPAGLGMLASTNKKFHRLAPSVETNAGMIQTLVQKQRLFDLGLRVAYLPKAGEAAGLQRQRWVEKHAFIIQHPQWRGRYMFSVKNELILSENGRFSSQSPELEERYVCATASYVFTRKEGNLEGRDLDGRLLFNIPVAGNAVQVFELPSQPDRERILLVMDSALQVWDITEKENVVRLFTHAVLPLMVGAYQFENTIVLVRSQRGAASLWVYNTDNLERAPQEMPHPVHRHFYMMAGANATHLYLRTRPFANIVACTVREGAFTYAWDLVDPRKTRFLCANEKWLVGSFEKFSNVEQPSLIVVREAITGRVAGEFYLPFSYEHHAVLWGKDILVTYANDANTLRFWSLPEGTALLSYKIEQCKIKQVLVRGKQLLVHYQDTQSNQRRIISWNTPPCPAEAGAPNELPHMTPVHPAHKEPSLCDRIWACVSSIFDWLVSLFKRFL